MRLPTRLLCLTCFSVAICSCFALGIEVDHHFLHHGLNQQKHNALEGYKVENAKVALQEKVAIKTNVSEPMKNGDWVEVSWEGVDNPAVDDYVALYLTNHTLCHQTAPVKYKWAVRAPSHLVEGRGSLRFRLVNMRDSLRFAFIRNGMEYPEVAALSSEVHVLNPNEPMQGHLALTGNPSEMAVQWTTASSQSPEVQWGRSSGSYDHSAAGQTQTYTREEMCGPPANASGWHDPGLLHYAVMTGLEPSTQYYYVYGDAEHGFSPEASFLSAPKVGPDSSVKFLAIADMGQAEVDGSNEESEMWPSLNTTLLLEADMNANDDWQLLIHNGDISYARGYVTHWDVFFDQIEPVVTRMPYMTQMGNHERNWPGSGDRFPAEAGIVDSGGECGIAYERRLRMPTPSEDHHWYSFDFGPIHFLQYSTEHDFQPGSPQHDFMRADLAAVDRSRTPWLVVGGHRPIYIDSTYDINPDSDQVVARDLQAALEDLFLQYQVDMTWHGHHHSYQRSCPVYKGNCMPANADGSASAPVHLVIGNAGAGLCYNVIPHRPPFWAVVKVQHGYMRVAANGTAFHCQVVRDWDGALLDDFTLTKPSGWAPKDPSAFGAWRPQVEALYDTHLPRHLRTASRDPVEGLSGVGLV